MKHFLNQIPVSICGLILGLVSLGHLFFSIQHTLIGWAFTGMGILLMLLFFMKITVTGRDTLKTLDNPGVAAISPTFPMSLMVLCNILGHFTVNDPLIFAVWWLAIILHFGLMAFFALTFVTPNRMKSEYINPGWFVTFVGIGVIPTTSSNFGVEFGQIVIWIALAFYLILLPLVISQVIKQRTTRATLPLVAIVAAPGSLCLTGYISVMEHPSEMLVYLLLILSQTVYFLIVMRLPRIMRFRFHPSYAALTFPVVISATAIIYTLQMTDGRSLMNSILGFLSTIELSLAVIIVTYVLIRYSIFIVQCYADNGQSYN
ncbi:TDT family transporter [Salinicoccus bachuensis]|uniref:TDT family transporter n=1 Tax=Salinicoccus bachuensis TaxID=3136731 RepID=A0ABZ3CHW5_9STAP